MIKSLRIENYILIREQNIDFENGFNVLTGETGAGKSIIVGAINAIFGKPTSSSVLINPLKSAFLEICLEISPENANIIELLQEYGCEKTGLCRDGGFGPHCTGIRPLLCPHSADHRSYHRHRTTTGQEI